MMTGNITTPVNQNQILKVQYCYTANHTCASEPDLDNYISANHTCEPEWDFDDDWSDNHTCEWESDFYDDRSGKHTCEPESDFDDDRSAINNTCGDLHFKMHIKAGSFFLTDLRNTFLGWNFLHLQATNDHKC